MTTSQTTFLSDLVPGERVSVDTFHYWRARAKREAYDLVLSEFKKSGITKTELAKRLGKTLPEVSRMLGGPANWTIATVSDLLFAIAGGVPTWGVAAPHRRRRNDKRPTWLEQESPILRASAAVSRTANSASISALVSQLVSPVNPTKPQDRVLQTANNALGLTFVIQPTPPIERTKSQNCSVLGAF